jgi:hypothetical protein
MVFSIYSAVIRTWLHFSGGASVLISANAAMEIRHSDVMERRRNYLSGCSGEC